MSTWRSSAATTRRSRTHRTSTRDASQRKPHAGPVVAARLEPEPLVERPRAAGRHQPDERPGAAQLANVVEQRLGDARPDPVVAPPLEDDPVLQVEVEDAVPDDPSPP